MPKPHFPDFQENEQYTNPKSFVNFLLPPLHKGRVGVGLSIQISNSNNRDIIITAVLQSLVYTFFS
ncbi:MAG: hypothetical protein EAZ78_14255 [Oscillatoriales cyanobacterium]|nr:MAG: hypothetical protein EA000_17825 [Oscillatoriales cyanobacterium]TAF02828.1 MAG: hypothetical protein EAZ78_14255 [Oscillatoriales cyanobacterium]TAF37016.1 MAG: hypothetical protein EAZ68_15530 [Oscillatoriales cyanobacterium]TAF71282.1 MAG: hypothetical protein EAZ59_01620 [Oscillatoriales cyanobacterium]